MTLALIKCRLTLSLGYAMNSTKIVFMQFLLALITTEYELP